jgi:hypothetical protein
MLQLPFCNTHRYRDTPTNQREGEREKSTIIINCKTRLEMKRKKKIQFRNFLKIKTKGMKISICQLKVYVQQFISSYHFTVLYRASKKPSQAGPSPNSVVVFEGERSFKLEMYISSVSLEFSRTFLCN